MNDDLTLLYYTANTIEEYLAKNVRRHLLETADNKMQIVSVSQKPIDFGTTDICVGEIGKSYYNCYKQILEGARYIKTEYTACCEDDTLYSAEHFTHRPSSKNVFSYNKNMWYTEETEYWNKGWNGMCTCIVRTQYLVETLEKRFKKFPNPANVGKRQMIAYFSEPGKRDKANTEFWYSKIPILTFNYFNALGGKAKSVAHPPKSCQVLEPWGDCWELKKKFWGRARSRNECPPKYA